MRFEIYEASTEAEASALYPVRQYVRPSFVTKYLEGNEGDYLIKVSVPEVSDRSTWHTKREWLSRAMHKDYALKMQKDYMHKFNLAEREKTKTARDMNDRITAIIVMRDMIARYEGRPEPAYQGAVERARQKLLKLEEEYMTELGESKDE